MDIDKLKINISWDNINKELTTSLSNISLKEAHIYYTDGDIKIDCKLKGGMPFSIVIDTIKCDGDEIKIHIKDIFILIKLPEILKSAIINDNLLKRIAGFDKDSIMYFNKSNILIIKKCLIDKYIGFSNYNIRSVSFDLLGIELESENIKLSKDNKLVNCDDKMDIEQIEDNEVFYIEDFNLEKAQDYYGKLRERIEKYIKSGVPSKYHYLIPYILMLPDTLALLIRLFKDKRIKIEDKALVISGIIYIISPFDIIPDILLPFGLLDDLGVAFYVLDKLILSIPESILKDNFEGNDKVIDFIKNGYAYIKNIIPSLKMEKIIGLFCKILNKNQNKE